MLARAWLLASLVPGSALAAAPQSGGDPPPAAEESEVEAEAKAEPGAEGEAPQGEPPTQPEVADGAAEAEAPAETEPEADAPPEPEPEAEPAPPPPPLELIPRAKRVPRGATPKEPEEEDVRTIRVSADPFGSGSDEEVFRHAAGRSTVDRATIQKRGAASFTEALSKTPGVRSVEGIAGVGSTATKLNVGVRGANPRLSDSATVLLDEIPLALAPYGQPELSLFPVSLFSIDRIDAVRGGTSVRFGPQTAGGVFNLMTKPIPRAPEASLSTRVDQFGHVITAGGFGTTIDRFGIYAEYAPQFGRSFRDNSGVHVEAGLLKLRWEPNERVDLSSTSHLYWEDSGLPGGLSRAAYETDPFGTTRPNDRFAGWRAGEAVKLGWRPRQNQQLQLFGYYNHSDRFTRLTNIDGRTVRTLTRIYDSIGVEPRYAVRLGESERAYVDLTLGVRGAFELASLRRVEALQANPALVESEGDADARVGALAAYVEQAHSLLDERIVLRAGVRSEVFRTTRRDNLMPGPGGVASQTFAYFMPSLSLWVSPRDEVSAFVGYARSVGPPSFVQLTAAAFGNPDATRAELVDTVESGVRLEDLYGLWAEGTVWFRLMQGVRDVGLETVIIMAERAYAGGLESEVGWAPGDLWDALAESEIYAGYVFTRSRIMESELGLRGKEVPWYPRHEVWAGLAYAFPWKCSFVTGVESEDECRTLQIGGDVEWSDTQFADYPNTLTEPPDGAVGLIPGYTLVDAYARFKLLLPRYWALNLTVGVKNMLDAEWFYRTDDINEGILPQRPRTFYVTLDVKHWFFDARARANERRDARRERRRLRRGLGP